MKRSFFLDAISLSALACTSLTYADTTANPAPIEAHNGGLENIVVNARRVDEVVQEVPITITAISPETMRQEHLVDVASLPRVTPSMTVTNSTRGSSTPAYMIRGQRAFSVNTLSEPAVTVYFAEVGQSLPTGTNLSLYDLQTVQVLKGPQGTLFGRNTTGGAVLLTPQAPTEVFDGYTQFSAGNYNLRDFEGAVNLPLTDTLAMRIAGKIQKRDGYLKNPVRGDEAGDANAKSGRLSIRWAPTDAFESTTIATYFKDDVVNATKLFAVEPTRIPALPGPFKPILTGQLLGALATLNSLGDYEYSDASTEYSRDTVWGVQNSSSYDFETTSLDSLSVKNIIGYRDIDTAYSMNIDGSTVAIVNSPSTVTATQLSDELQVFGSKDNLDMTAGLFYYRLNSEDRADSYQFASLSPLVPSAFPALSIQDYGARNKSYAAFIHANYKLDGLLEGLSVSAGARKTKDERRVIYHNRTSGGTNPVAFKCLLTGQTGLPNDASLCSTAASKTFSNPTWDISVNYQATRTVLVYLAHRHGYRAGGFNTSPSSAATIQDFVFDPETVNDFEIGLKSDFTIGDMDGRFNAAVYRSNYSDIQRTTNFLTPAGAVSSKIQNAAKAHINGAEAELTLKPIESVTLALNGAVIDAKYDKWTDSYDIDPTAAVNLATIDISDSKFALVPKTQINGSITYDVPFDPSYGDLSLRVSYYRQSSIETAEINTSNCGPDGLYPHCVASHGSLPGYGLVNLRADWRNVASLGFDVAAFVDNATDKSYSNDAVNGLGIFGTAAKTIAPPRMYGVEIRVPFGSSAHKN